MSNSRIYSYLNYRTLAKKRPWAVHFTLGSNWGVGGHSRNHHCILTRKSAQVYTYTSLASKTLSPLLFCYAEFYGRGEGSSNSCNIPCAAAHYRKPQCGLACGRYVNSLRDGKCHEYNYNPAIDVVLRHSPVPHCVALHN